MTTNQSMLLNASNENILCGQVAVECDDFHLGVSCGILALALITFLENLLLILATNNWDLKKTCKMFWFLWHLAVADALLSFAFIYYHTRIISLCPQSYRCQPSYFHESVGLVVLFFGTIVASHLLVVAATADRFIAIKWSLRYSELVSTKTVRGVAIAIWIYSFGVPISGELIRVFLNLPDAHNVVVFMTSSICLLSAALIITFNIWMVVFAWRSLLKIPKLSLHSLQRGKNNSVVDTEFVHERLKLAVTLLLFVFSFVLSCLPWSLTLVVCNEKSETCVLKQDGDYILVLVLLHALVLPVLYGFRVKAIKRCVIDFCLKLFNNLKCKNTNRT